MCLNPTWAPHRYPAGVVSNVPMTPALDLATLDSWLVVKRLKKARTGEE